MSTVPTGTPDPVDPATIATSAAHRADVAEFSGRHNIRQADTRVQMAHVVEGMVGKRIRYQTLITDNRLPSGARAS